MKKLDYKGKRVFIGIDVHKKSYTIAAICEGEVVKKATLPGERKRLLEYLSKHFSGAEFETSYEAGFSGFYLHRHLTKKGIKNIVVHPAAIEISARDKVKTDKRDALKIATQLAAKRLEGVHVPSPEQEDRRELTRLRERLIKTRTRLGAQLKHKAHYYGFSESGDIRVVSKKWIEELLKNPMRAGLRYHVESLAEEWREISRKIQEVEKLLRVQAKEDESHEKVYRSVPGIGPVSARILSNELGDMSQFKTEGSLFSYVGLTPREYSSGEHRRQGHITGQGKPVLRRVLTQCSWVAIKQDKGLQEIYERIARRRGGKRAIIGIARRLIGRARACFRKGEEYTN